MLIILLVTLGIIMATPADAILQCHKTFCPPKETVQKPKERKNVG